MHREPDFASGKKEEREERGCERSATEEWCANRRYCRLTMPQDVGKVAKLGSDGAA